MRPEQRSTTHASKPATGSTTFRRAKLIAERGIDDLAAPGA
jgi:hypothetical protein